MNLTGSSPLFGLNEERYGARFPDCSHLYTAADAAPGLVVAGLVGLHAAQLPSLRRWLRLQGVQAVAPVGLLHLSVVARHSGMTCAAVAAVQREMAGLEGRAQWLPPVAAGGQPSSQDAKADAVPGLWTQLGAALTALCTPAQPSPVH